MLKPWWLLRCWNSVKSDALGLQAYTLRAGISTGGQNYASKRKLVNKVDASYCIFKGKAALSIRPVLPTFTELNSGNFVIDRRGVMLLTFFPAVGEHKYDFEKRKHFALSTTEVGSLLALGPSDSSEFFHDPSMLSSNAGQVRKSLSVKPYSGGNGSGYHVSLSVVNNVEQTNDRFHVPLTSAEFAVLKTACNFALPLIMGWYHLTATTATTATTASLRMQSNKVENASAQLSTLEEWDR